MAVHQSSESCSSHPDCQVSPGQPCVVFIRPYVPAGYVYLLTWLEDIKTCLCDIITYVPS